jgi:hypothetical protein
MFISDIEVEVVFGKKVTRLEARLPSRESN